MTANELVVRHRDLWQAATHHSFLDGVCDGSLPLAAFQTWLVQDYLFVLDLLRFQAQLLSIAPRAGQRTLAVGLGALEAELSWFESRATRLGLQLDTARHHVTEAYRQRLGSYGDNWPSGITALWTGERAYLEAWTGVAPGAAVYREFVEHWTHPDFAAYVTELEKMVDAAGPVEMAFVAICDLERDFWDMVWNSAIA